MMKGRFAFVLLLMALAGALSGCEMSKKNRPGYRQSGHPGR